MITKLEKQFFDTFGIEPKYKTCVFTYCKNKKEYDCENCNDREWHYPKISDKHYLELICILNDYTGIDVRAIKIEELKEELLEHCIELIEYELYNDDDIDNFKHQVQAIFKGDK